MNNQIAFLGVTDYYTARIAGQSKIDALVVGDRHSMLCFYGYQTAPSIELLKSHVSSVKMAAPTKAIFVVVNDQLLSQENWLNSCKQLSNGTNGLIVHSQHIQKIKEITTSGITVFGILDYFNVEGYTDNLVAVDTNQLDNAIAELELAGCQGCIVKGAQVNGPLKRSSITLVGYGTNAACDGQFNSFYHLTGCVPALKNDWEREYANFFTVATNALKTHHQHLEAVAAA